MAKVFWINFATWSVNDLVGWIAGANTATILNKSMKWTAWEFNGSTSKIQYSSPQAFLSVSNSFTIECVFKTGQDITTTQSILWSSVDTNNRFWLSLWTWTIRAGMYNWSFLWNKSWGVNVNTRYHVIYKFDWVNWILVLNNSLQWGTATPNTSLTNAFTIWCSVWWSWFFQGKILSYNIRNTLLDTKTMERLYKDFLALQQTSTPINNMYNNDAVWLNIPWLVAAYNMKKNWLYVADVSGNGNTMTLSAGTGWTTLPISAKWQMGEALLFTWWKQNNWVIVNWTWQVYNNWSMTISVLYKPRWQSPGAWRLLIAHAVTTWNWNRLYIAVNPSNQFYATVFSWSWSDTLTATTILSNATNHQYHIVFMLDYPNKRIKLVIDWVDSWWQNTTTTSPDVTLANILVWNQAVSWTTSADWTIDSLRFYNRVLADNEWQWLLNSYNKPLLREVFNYAADWQTKTSIQWRQTITWTRKIWQYDASDGIVKIWQKYIENVSLWQIFIPSYRSSGTIEFTINKLTDTSSISLYLMQTQPTTSATWGTWYTFLFSSAEAIAFRSFTGWTETNRIASAAWYAAINTNYRIKITRTITWVRTVYIKWWAFWTIYTLLSVTWWTGTNPVTNTTYNVSNYFWINSWSSWVRLSDLIMSPYIY